MQRRRFVGFTLIELLVVIAILALLAALGTGAYFRMRGAQQTKLTEETVTKLETALQNAWKSELDAARDAFKGKTQGFIAQADTVRAIAGGDQDRALALWTYLWMKNAFPQTFVEANNATTLAVTINSPTGALNLTATLPARFSGLGGITPLPDQGAALLHKILTLKGARGQVFNEEAIGALSVKFGTTNHRVFTDTFGNPITFVRMCSGNQGDLNAAPYIKTGTASKDPLDPQGRLLPTKWTATAAPAQPPRVQAATSFGFTDFTDANWVPTIVSRGPATTWGTLLGTATGLVPVPDGMISGYKLRRQGNRGDQ